MLSFFSFFSNYWSPSQITPMSSKLRADYVELINAYLDKISIESVSQYEVVISRLGALLDGRFQSDKTVLDASIESICELLEMPESYVEKAEHYAEYRDIIKTRIRAKITELTEQNEQDRQRSVTELNERRVKTEANQALMRRHMPPLLSTDEDEIEEEMVLTPQELATHSLNLMQMLDANPRDISIMIGMLGFVSKVDRAMRHVRVNPERFSSSMGASYGTWLLTRPLILTFAIVAQHMSNRYADFSEERFDNAPERQVSFFNLLRFSTWLLSRQSNGRNEQNTLIP